MNLSIISVFKNHKINFASIIKSILLKNYKDFEYVIFYGI